MSPFVCWAPDERCSACRFSGDTLLTHTATSSGLVGRRARRERILPLPFEIITLGATLNLKLALPIAILIPPRPEHEHGGSERQLGQCPKMSVDGFAIPSLWTTRAPSRPPQGADEGATVAVAVGGSSSACRGPHSSRPLQATAVSGVATTATPSGSMVGTRFADFEQRSGSERLGMAVRGGGPDGSAVGGGSERDRTVGLLSVISRLTDEQR
jgi:hypothetical protein